MSNAPFCQRFPPYIKELELRFNNRDKPLIGQLAAYLCALVPSVE